MGNANVNLHGHNPAKEKDAKNPFGRLTKTGFPSLFKLCKCKFFVDRETPEC